MGCDPCLGLTIPDNFEQNCQLITKDCGVDSLYVAACDQAFDDLTQDSFDTAVNAGKLKKLPIGDLVITSSTSNPIKLNGCKEIPGSTTYTLTYTSYSASEDDSEYKYWLDFFTNVKNYTMLWKQCDNIWFINQKWAQWNINGQEGDAPTDESIGINIGVTQPPIKTRNDTVELCQWTVIFTYKYNSVLIGTTLPGIEIGEAES